MKDKSQPGRARGGGGEGVAVLSYFFFFFFSSLFLSLCFCSTLEQPAGSLFGVRGAQGKGSRGRLAAFLAAVWAPSAAGPAVPPVCASTCWPASWRPAPPAPPAPARPPAPRPARRPLGESGDGEGTREVFPASQAFPAQPVLSSHGSSALRPALP